MSSYPLSLAQTRLRINKDASMLQVVTDIIKHNAPVALYRGCSAKMAQTILTAAFMFSFYERIHGAMSSALLARGIA